MVLDEPHQPLLVLPVRGQVGPDPPRIARHEPVVETLVVAEVEALLLQRPFEVPVGLREETETGVRLADRGDDRDQ
ncbi:hypothetical protein GCM10023215_39540 [Pseudonocardia yuanmonensis]|uniref:Uncharacterized protein n=1 Tax=Pseudonocardia yuanmonensis TaxID=1095914 RepID=A0ABP8WZT0_9PSEU